MKIVIFETATGKRATEARLVARVSEPGIAPRARCAG